VLVKTPGGACRKTVIASLACCALAAAWLPRAALAQSAWLQRPAVQARLAAGKVVARSALDARHGSASVDAAIRVHAPPEAIWPLITQCRYAAILIPGLRHCKRLRSAPDGSWAIIEHDIKYAVLLPQVHSVFRADFHPPLRMDFHRIAGSLKEETGSWILQPSADGTTTVEYRVSMKPGFWVPHSMIRRSLQKQLPAALVALRAHAQRQSADNLATGHSAASPAPAHGS
jgi:Polyketide cyclase / dehydrase and lipid transport